MDGGGGDINSVVVHELPWNPLRYIYYVLTKE